MVYFIQAVLLVALVMVILQRINSIYVDLSPYQTIQTILMIAAAILIFLDNIKLSFIERNFLFMKHFKGKVVFHLLLGTLLVSKSAVSGLQRLVGIFYILFAGLIIVFMVADVSSYLPSEKGIYKKGSDYLDLESYEAGAEDKNPQCAYNEATPLKQGSSE
ncbi:UNKNOWN [Stylonychia lemnae]|uniref:COPI associated protein n=1 Tax=Stylonychia lemnae TaxID=5949 RepID=A0A078AKB5_STYLE|nr:UNKNOWN [Stylonychia lemnae]|eukprot:CDW82336.1 UNKNOWN [Stylonychia lemnae]